MGPLCVSRSLVDNTSEDAFRSNAARTWNCDKKRLRDESIALSKYGQVDDARVVGLDDARVVSLFARIVCCNLICLIFLRKRGERRCPKKPFWSAMIPRYVGLCGSNKLSSPWSSRSARLRFCWSPKTPRWCSKNVGRVGQSCATAQTDIVIFEAFASLALGCLLATLAHHLATASKCKRLRCSSR